MKAIVCEQYGSSELLKIKDIDGPTSKGDQILVDVKAVALNPADWRQMRADPFIVRFETGLLRPKGIVMGADVAGVVVSTGPDVTRFQAGDAVFGEVSTGGFAEFACDTETRFSLLPAKLSFEEGASVALAGNTALQALRAFGELQSGQSILINGASGGIGTFAVQLAKSMGGIVTAVCSQRNVELVCSLGADHVIDYAQTDFTRTGQRYDLILDLVGNRSVNDLHRVLAPSGRCALVGFSTISHMLGSLLRGRWLSRRGDQKIAPFLANPTPEDLDHLAELLTDGSLRPIIDRQYHFDQIPEALTYLETGRARGKVVASLE